MSNFIGKTILITGASSGIGRATAVYLDSLGARHILIGRSEEQLRITQSSLKNESVLCTMDLSDVESIESKIKPVVKDFGALSGFVHCAGMLEHRPLAMCKFENLHKVMLTNFYSFFELARIVTKKGIYSSEGMNIVVISSVVAKTGRESQTAYGSSKAAIIGAVHSMAKELAPKKIRVNAVLPAAVNTTMLDKYYDLKEMLHGGEGKPQDRQYLGMCQPEYVASAIAFLLSDDSKWITGAEIPVDGGYLE